jgi:hypothetical protein
VLGQVHVIEPFSERRIFKSGSGVDHGCPYQCVSPLHLAKQIIDSAYDVHGGPPRSRYEIGRSPLFYHGVAPKRSRRLSPGETA